MAITIRPVQTKKEEQAFLDFARTLYADDPNWIPPLDMEIRKLFDVKQNPYLKGGGSQKWIAVDDATGEVKGRIGAFIDPSKATKFDRPTGGTGFFECVQNLDVAKALFQSAERWLKERGMEAMNGPINIGDNHMYWGLLVEGFRQPAYGMLYNKPYYKDFYEAFGFKVYFQQLSKMMDLTKPLPERFRKIAKWVNQKDAVAYKLATPSTTMEIGMDIMKIYNEAWKHHDNFSPLTEDKVATIAKDLKQILIPELIPVAYVHGEPAGFIIAIPDLNQIFKPFRGKITLWEGLKFAWRKRNGYAWYLKRGVLTRARVLIMGVHPKYQKYGLESGLVVYPMERIKAMGFKEIELSWVGDFNPAMQAIQNATGATDTHKHHTYRYVFNDVDHQDYHHIISMDHRVKAGA